MDAHDVVDWRRRVFATGTDGVVPLERYGVVALPDVGELDVWRLTSYGADSR